ncbi:spore morphogenesis/germination protein YwcE [Saliterribacillus persicus]|uniref:BSH family holin n=1 Tax=Saliterribacillus persicus TaxID=930114 RepID=A0A368Y7L7_9BACI|nr:spore morphogenesis/germination protein YwcE [Saliterribacillus persicus]RCW74807.1 BSH family holin [Saliterribacillus persicus]
MDILLIFLFIFSATPLLLWADNWKKTAIGQIPFILAAWFVFIKYVTTGISGAESFLWVFFYANLIYGHIAFTIMLLEMRKSMKSKQSFINREA